MQEEHFVKDQSYTYTYENNPYYTYHSGVLSQILIHNESLLMRRYFGYDNQPNGKRIIAEMLYDMRPTLHTVINFKPGDMLLVEKRENPLESSFMIESDACWGYYFDNIYQAVYEFNNITYTYDGSFDMYLEHPLFKLADAVKDTQWKITNLPDSKCTTCYGKLDHSDDTQADYSCMCD